MTAFPVDLDDVRESVAEVLGVDPPDLDVDENLFGLGVDSMMLVRLAGGWRAAGFDVDFGSLALRPTVSAWHGLLQAAGPVAPVVDSEASGGVFPLATMQHGYWVGRAEGQVLGGVASHLYVEFDGFGVDVERLRGAVDALVARHPALRTRFVDQGGQEVLDAPERPVFSVVDFRGLDPATVASELATLRERRTHQVLDIGAGQVIDVGLTRLPGGRSRLHVDVDMIAADAMSYRTILTDLAEFYRGGRPQPEVLTYDYRQYLADREVSTAATRERDSEWWAERVGDYPGAPSLPLVSDAGMSDPSRSVRRDFRLSPAQREMLYRRSQEHGVTPAMVLATVFADVVARWSTAQRFLLNLPLFDREPLHPDVKFLVGDFSNSVLLDIEVDPQDSFVGRVRSVQQNLHAHAAHAGYRGLDVLRDLGRTQGSPVVAPVVYTSGLNLGELFDSGVTEAFGDPVWIISQGSQVGLDAQVVELGGGILLNWDVRRDAFPPGVIEAMFAAYQGLIDQLLAADADWDAPYAIPLPAAQQQVRDRVNDTAMDVPPRTLHGEFFRRAIQHPNHPAVLWGTSGSYSYGELADAALRVATALQEVGVAPGDTVAIQLRKDYRQIPAVLGVLAAGATYLPIGEDQPPARRDVMLDRGDAEVIIINSDSAGQPDGVRAVLIDDALHHRSALIGPVRVDPCDIAYVLFTSGSTGEPKGVEIPHKSAANTLDGIGQVFGLSGQDRTLGVSVLEFDLSVVDIFGALSWGGAYIVVDGDAAKDAFAWADLAGRYRASAITCAPGVFRMLLDVATAEQLESLYAVMLGGDWVTVDLPRRLAELAPRAQFAGLGGTTETSVHCTVCMVGDHVPDEWQAVPYGTPLPNFVCRVVNDSGQDCPDWVAGELWIGGPSVGAGYRADPQRTAQRFLEHDGVRWYRTGDLARYHPDGSIEFLGRADHQVKIRGYRVELGEVEAALRDLDGLDQAIAVTTNDSTPKLVAAVTGVRELDGDTIRAQLADKLPPYMIPERIQILDEIPLNRNGKHDRRTITTQLAGATCGDDAPPTTTLEAALQHIIDDVLPKGLPGVDTDFFAAGGDSILATTAVARIRSLLQLTTMTAADFFTTRTVRELARMLRAASDDLEQLAIVADIYVEVAEITPPHNKPDKYAEHGKPGEHDGAVTLGD